MRPLSATTSPGWAPDRTTGAEPPSEPTTVTAMVSVGLPDVSPPTTTAPVRAASSASPSASSSAQATGRLGGAHRATTSAVGTPPIAAMSARLAAAARCPTSRALDQSRRKCRPSTSTSVLIATRPSGASTSAASSPGPMSTPGAGGAAAASRAVTRAINPNSPMVATVTQASSRHCHDAYF
jgi:hypothetical protein